MNNKREQASAMRNVAIMMLMASGANIVAPQELANPELDKLGVNDEPLATPFAQIDAALQGVDSKVAATLIQAAVVKHLRPVEIMKLNDNLQPTWVSAILHYVSEHTEAAQPAPFKDVEEALGL